MTVDDQLQPEEGWRLLPQPFGNDTFVSGARDNQRMRVRYCRDAEGNVVGKAWFGPGAQGPPGHVHGGAMAALLDEAMGAAAWICGHEVLAARLSIGFHRMVPLGSVVRIETQIVANAGRKVTVRGLLKTARGEVVCDAEGLYLEVELERMDAVSGDAVRSIKNTMGRLLADAASEEP